MNQLSLARFGRDSRRERGFILLEVLVGFVIAALALGVIVHVAIGAVLASRIASRVDEAVARAASHLAALSAAPLIDSDRQGDEGGGFHWHIRVANEGAIQPAADLAAIPKGTVTLYRISVVVSWTEDGHRRAVRLNSARLDFAA